MFLSWIVGGALPQQMSQLPKTKGRYDSTRSRLKPHGGLCEPAATDQVQQRGAIGFGQDSPASLVDGGISCA